MGHLMASHPQMLGSATPGAPCWPDSLRARLACLRAARRGGQPHPVRGLLPEGAAAVAAVGRPCAGQALLQQDVQPRIPDDHGWA